MSDAKAGWVELQAGDGHRLRAYHAEAVGEELGRLIVAPEIFGINHHIRGVCDGLARQGFTALAPDLFDRAERGVELPYDDAGIQRGIALKGQVSNEAALSDIAAALAFLGGDRRAAIVGYCWGGSLAWAAASALPVRAAIGYYGGDIGNRLADAPRVPTLLHFGEQDHAIPLSVAEEVRARYPWVPVHTYPAGHGFNCDERGSYHRQSAELALRRTLGLLRAVF
ncbi:dienelactone hydrolase family protein [Azospirillum picis]|uniref:Carboxymethylenebutenolidase n=1 Tax=Azospirillum picis TaxID=488438 RepID=A0ABU0MLU7_9PROT|nr:dienelactone hydrolase family protein [Azospirillum picis]MBP2303566.1 carboxymethylenebutenolidase [Azospirillum picis]MDQ0534444.1 carboxymethylenebutenolidase [Azospirillum picis]